MASLLDPLRFAAGVYLLNAEQEAELDKIRARASGELYLVEASKYILRTVDHDELERTYALMVAGEIPLPILLNNPEEGKRKR